MARARLGVAGTSCANEKTPSTCMTIVPKENGFVTEDELARGVLRIQVRGGNTDAPNRTNTLAYRCLP